MFKRPKLYATIFGILALAFLILPRLLGLPQISYISGALGMMFFLFAVMLIIGKSK